MKFPKVIMALDFSKMDKAMLSYFKHISSIFGVEEIYFLHIIKMFALPKLIMSEWGPILKPDFSIDETCQHQLQQEVNAYNLPIHKNKIHCEVHEGRPVSTMVSWSEKHQADLVIFGNKKKHAGSGITSRRMAHRLKSSMLFIPEKHNTSLLSITVLFDFSEDSIRALLAALRICNQTNGMKIKVLHVQDEIKAQLYPATGSNTAITNLARERTLVAFEKLITENEIDKNSIEFVLLDQIENSIAQTLKEYLILRPTDLVIMGSVGHTQGHNILYGSTTERFVDSYLESPILVIR